ncbi:peptidoglycan D,D-transpeptidase FtsI family protein [Alkalihalobacillus sp. 1P02AB]|uniref:peptidoglycan D,D-transpeptidase FtsI family protein n=1 Tax=Alkalihalobacillus sp. 1P02AB TaxID=3132260 RepID=UPI0039A4A88C
MTNKEKTRKKRQVPVRLNILFFAVFILFSILILRLGYVQIVQGEEFQKELERTSNSTARIDAPRGIMYDRYGNIVVDNELVLSLTYTNPSQQTRATDMLKLAWKLQPLIEIDTENVREFTLREYLLLQLDAEEIAKLTDDIDTDDMTSGEIYRAQINAIPEGKIEQISDRELEVIAIFQEMSAGYANTPQRIKKDITDKEAHVISERLSELPGIDILRDSERTYPFGNNFLFGNIRSIPSEQIDSFLARGYSRADQVGVSFLEMQYEEALRGQKAEVENITTTSGSSVQREITEKLGQRGNDLVLSLDMEYQQLLEEAVERQVKTGALRYLGDKNAYAIVMEPNTGEVLAMVGYEDKVGAENGPVMNHQAIVNNGFEMGSTIKAATVLAGFESGAMPIGATVYDRPIRVAGQPYSSLNRTLGNIGYSKALERSSNIYMIEVGLRLANYRQHNNRLILNEVSRAYDTLKYYFHQFGLGVDTGIDLPSSSVGYIGDVVGQEGAGGLMLQFTFGQFDQYTPLQMAQYISTIANGGNRVQPRLVNEIRQPYADKDELGPVIQSFGPNILNRLDMNDDMISRVQQSLELVVHGGQGTAPRLKDDVNHNIRVAAKTGTAQVRYNGRDANNQTLVGYAPADDPEIAFAIVVPNTSTSNGYNISQGIGVELINDYFDLKEERQGPTKVERDEDAE